MSRYELVHYIHFSFVNRKFPNLYRHHLYNDLINLPLNIISKRIIVDMLYYFQAF